MYTQAAERAVCATAGRLLLRCLRGREFALSFPFSLAKLRVQQLGTLSDVVDVGLRSAKQKARKSRCSRREEAPRKSHGGTHALQRVGDDEAFFVDVHCVNFSVQRTKPHLARSSRVPGADCPVPSSGKHQICESTNAQRGVFHVCVCLDQRCLPVLALQTHWKAGGVARVELGSRACRE